MTPLQRLSLALLGMLVATTGCIPGPTREFSDIGVKANNGGGDDDTGTTMTSGMGDGGMTNSGNSQQFLAVVDIITTNCALGGCHGSPPASNQVFSLITGQDATAGEVEAALTTSSPTGTGNPLVSPGSPEMSEIYVRITKPDGDEQQMPPTGPLMMADVMTIQNWISNGAPY